MTKRLLSYLLSALRTFTFGLFIFSLTYGFLATPELVLGSSMQPSLTSGEKIIIEKVTPKLNDLKRGQIAVIHSPVESGIDYIKRLIGMPGDTILIKDCHVEINGEILQEPYLSPATCTQGGTVITDNTPYAIPGGYIVVLGDNRGNSLDSRYFGAVPLSSVAGRALVRFWPIDKMRLY